MVESSKVNYRQKLYNNSVMTNVLQFWDKKDLLSFRHISPKMADEIVPMCFREYRYECPEEDDDPDYRFLKLIRHARKMIIKNICGTEAHLRKLEEIGKNQIGNIEYLYLEFDDDDNT